MPNAFLYITAYLENYLIISYGLPLILIRLSTYLHLTTCNMLRSQKIRSFAQCSI